MQTLDPLPARVLIAPRCHLLHLLFAFACCLQAPPDLPGVLSILGDTGDALYPIYRAGTSPADAAVVTLCTAVMDVAGGVLTVLAGNPMQQRVVLTLDVHTWRLALAPAASSATRVHTTE